MARLTVEKIEDKPDPRRRAGTPLTPGSRRNIYGPKKGGGKHSHGILDIAKRLYQTGGERGNFIYRQRSLVSMSYDVWRQIMGQADVIEFIDHTSNVCYRLSGQWIIEGVTPYDIGYGQRVGWPLAWFDVLDANQKVIQPGRPPVTLRP